METKVFNSHLKVDFKQPINFKEEWAYLFKPDFAYLDVELKVRELKNVFVNHYGLVIKNGLLVKGCAPNIGHTKYEDDNFHYRHWRKGIEQLLVSKYGRSLPSIRLDDNKKYLIIHSPWFSYYFWLTECLPRLLMVQDQLDDLILIYPEGWKKINYVNETLDLFPQLQRIEIPNDYHLFVKNLVLPEVKPWTPLIIPDQSIDVKNLILNAAIQKNITVKPIRKLYLSRADSKRKNFENEKEVSELLNKYEFEAVTFSGLSIFEQALLVNQAENIVSITGAGMSNFTFLSKDSNVLDVTNEKYKQNKKYKFHFWKLATIMEANYFVQFCQHTNHKDIPRFSLQNLIPDLNEMESNLKKMTSSK